MQYRSAQKESYFNEIELFQNKVPELKSLKKKVCIKTFFLVMKQLVKCLGVKSIATLDDYNEHEYFVFKNGMKFKIVENMDAGGKVSLECDC